MEQNKEPRNKAMHIWRKGSVQFSHSVMSDSLRPHELQHTRPPSNSSNSRSPPKPTFIESVMPSNHLILCHPLLLLPSIFPSIRVFSNESALHIRWPKYWSFNFNISLFNKWCWGNGTPILNHTQKLTQNGLKT